MESFLLKIIILSKYTKADSYKTGFSILFISLWNVLGAFVSLTVFKEKLSTINKVGIGLAVLAIVVFYSPSIF